MCFTLPGRVETRLFSLILPLGVMVLFAAVSGNSSYWTLFALMALIGLALDVGVYSWLIHYQPRWLTIALGGFEFLVILAVVTWLPLVQVGLEFGEALVFYVVAWSGALLTTQALLPLLWTRWAEDGGEIRVS